MTSLALDAMLVIAAVLIGVSVHRHAPALTAGYVGVLLLGVWWVLGSGRAAAAKGDAGDPTA